jgi:hypothetical protein
MAKLQKMTNGTYRARYREPSGQEHLHRTKLKKDAQRWLDVELAKIENGSWVAPRTAKTTVGRWCDTWLATYATRKPSTVRMAKVTSPRSKTSSELGDSTACDRQR